MRARERSLFDHLWGDFSTFPLHLDSLKHYSELRAGFILNLPVAGPVESCPCLFSKVFLLYLGPYY